MLNVAFGFANDWEALGEIGIEYRFHDRTPHDCGKILIPVEDFTLGVARVATKEFVAAVTGENAGDAIVLGHLGAVIGG